jgi:hypothetical protein
MAQIISWNFLFVAAAGKTATRWSSVNTTALLAVPAIQHPRWLESDRSRATHAM